MDENELNFINEEIKEEFFYYVKNKFGNGPKSKIRALNEAIYDWIYNEKYSQELSALIDDLDNKNGINAPRHAAYALRNFNDKKAVKALIKALKSEDVFVRRKSAISLGHICDESSIKPLISSLKDSDFTVRDNAAWALAEIGESAIQPLINALYNKNNYIRSGAASSLSEMELICNLADLNKALIESLDDDYNVVRRRAIKFLETICHKDGEITSFLIKALKDEDLFVRENALLTLGKIGNKNSIEYIIRASYDENTRIQDAAEHAWNSLKERIVNNEF